MQAWGEVHEKALKYNISTLTFVEVQVQVHGIVLTMSCTWSKQCFDY